jgi:hypothetical protein
MKNFFVLILLIAMTLTFGVTAQAAVQSINGWFSIDVPDGWTTHNSEEGLFVSITSPEGTEIITFEYASAEGMDPCQFAENNSGNLGGSSPVVETERGDYEFMYTDNDATVTARAFMVESIGIVMKTQQGFDGIYKILDTFTW